MRIFTTGSKEEDMRARLARDPLILEAEAIGFKFEIKMPPPHHNFYEIPDDTPRENWVAELAKVMDATAHESAERDRQAQAETATQ
jgi:hypothetical protein